MREGRLRHMGRQIVCDDVNPSAVRLTPIRAPVWRYISRCQCLSLLPPEASLRVYAEAAFEVLRPIARNLTEIERALLVGASCRFLAGTFARTLQPGEASASDLCHRCLRAIRLSFASPDISLEQIAKVVGASPTHVCRTVSGATGRPFRFHIIQWRVAAGMLLLWEPLSVKEVAYALGYRGTPEFCRQFKNVVNVTPGAYRQTVRVYRSSGAHLAKQHRCSSAWRCLGIEEPAAWLERSARQLFRG